MPTFGKLKKGITEGTTKLPSRFGSVIFQSNLANVVEIQEDASEKAVLAAAKVVAGYAKNVRLKRGFKGTATEPLEHAQNITAALVPEDERKTDGPEARAGLPESGAPKDVPYYVYWEMGHNSAVTEQWEREPWLTESLQKTRSVQANAAAAAARDRLEFSKQIKGFARGFVIFSAVSLFT